MLIKQQDAPCHLHKRGGRCRRALGRGALTSSDKRRRFKIGLSLREQTEETFHQRDVQHTLGKMPACACVFCPSEFHQGGASGKGGHTNQRQRHTALAVTGMTKRPPAPSHIRAIQGEAAGGGNRTITTDSGTKVPSYYQHLILV